MHRDVGQILEEINAVFQRTDFDGEEPLVDLISKSKSVVVVGAGRVGLNAAGFAKRLGHLGKRSFFINDQTLPSLGENDLVLFISGSGQTKSLVLLAEIAKAEGVPIALVTSSGNSKLKKLADASVVIECPSETNSRGGLKSVQPMTSLFEQISHLYLDALVKVLMRKWRVDPIQMRERHNILE